MHRPVTPYLLAAAVALASVFGLVSRPATGAPTEHADYVIIAGAAGLRWDDVTQEDTPTLWQLAQQGSIGALSVKSARTPTCPDDGWLTLGAGSYATHTGPRVQVTGACPPDDVDIQTPDGIGANLPDQETDVAAWNRELPYGAQPGALAEAVRCTVAVGPGAAIAAARPFGRVDRYESTLPDKPASLLSSCVLSIVDLGTISGSDAEIRRAQARAADATLAKLLAARPANSLVLVAGLSDTDQTSRLHVAIAHGPGYHGGWLTSSSTARPGYLQLIDLAPTTLHALGKAAPTKLFTGQPADNVPGRPADVAASVHHFSDVDREAGAQRRVAGWFFALLTVFDLALFVAVVPLLRRARRSAGPDRPAPLPDRIVRAVEILLVAGALALPAALIADVVPWWRSGLAGLVFAVTALGAIAAGTALVVLGPWRRGALGPLGAVGGLTAGIVGVDVLTGAHLQLNGVAGYSALEGSRYAGVGTVGLGLIIAGTLLISGWLAQRVPKRWRPAVVAVIGGVGVVLVGSPYLGADVGGAIALTAGVCVAAAIATGGFLTFGRIAWATLTGLAVTTGFALLDVGRPGGDRGGLGRFLAAAREGTGGNVIHRTGTANGTALFSSPLTLLVIGSGVLIVFALLRPWGGLKRLFGIYPAIRAVLLGIPLAAVIAGFVDGVGFDVAGSAAAVTVPLATLAALRVLGHADDRTGAGSGAAPPVPAGAPEPPVDEEPDPPTDAEPTVIEQPGRAAPAPAPDVLL